MITLATLDQATEQEVFDQVKNHLLTQMANSILEPDNDICAYRGVNGLQCAAGCLMSDEEATNIIEKTSWHSLSRKGLVPKCHLELINKLQDIHDFENPDDWANYLQNLAHEHGLTF